MPCDMSSLEAIVGWGLLHLTPDAKVMDFQNETTDIFGMIKLHPDNPKLRHEILC